MIVQSGRTATVGIRGVVDDALVAGLRRVVTDDDPIGAFLRLITTMGVRSAPDFVFIAAEDGAVRVLLRGGIHVGVEVDGATIEVEAADAVSTWSEHVYASASDVWFGDDGCQYRMALSPSDSAGVAPRRKPPARRPRPVQQPTAPTLAAHGVAAQQAEETLVGFEASPHAATAEGLPNDVDDDSSADIDLGNLFETRYRGVEAAAVRPDGVEGAPSGSPAPVVTDSDGEGPPAAPVPAGPTPPPLLVPTAPAPRDGPPSLIVDVPGAPAAAAQGEHDGLTVSGAALAALRTDLRSAASPVATGPTVQAVLCGARHPNPPLAATCRTCGGAIADREIVSVPRPVVGRLLFDSGMVVAIDRRLLLGRKPAGAANAPVDDLPSLVTLPDPETLLSRTHAELRVDGWDITIVDLKSQNGTYVIAPGQSEPMRLRPFDGYPVVGGMRILLADVAACRYEVGAS